MEPSTKISTKRQGTWAIIVTKQCTISTGSTNSTCLFPFPSTSSALMPSSYPRQETKVNYTKKYDQPTTPFQRIMALKDFDENVKDRLSKLYPSLNPAHIRRDILKLQERLYHHAKSPSRSTISCNLLQITPIMS